MDKTILTIKFDFKKLFPTDKPTKNGMMFTEESVKKAMNTIKDCPFIIEKDGKETPIGIIQDYSNGYLWVECYPEITVNDVQKINGTRIVNSFSVNAIVLK